jgi:uncharacterized membrane protein
MDQQNQNPVPNQVPPSSPSSKGNIIAIFSYIGILVIIPLFTQHKDDPFVKFHIKQGLVLLIAVVIGTAISMVPIIGWLLAPLIFLFNLILAIMGIINVLSNKQNQLPVIGKFADKINI